MRTLLLLALTGSMAIGYGCTQRDSQTAAALQGAKKTAEEPIDQKNLCEVSVWQHDAVAAVCKPGQKIVFLPQSFGNEQLPIYFAAVNCDLRYNVALTNGAVTCIYQPITPASPSNNAPPASEASR